ncbi:MAG TPA: CBS domain-containing protein [Kofleriaceae bacterium]|nr:CBS domain-containing protein [Kofleriaceae bacterium]
MATTTLTEIAATPIGTIARRQPVRVTPDTTLGEVVGALLEKGRGAVLVEEDGRIVGICSERDVMLRVDHGDPAWTKRPVREVMTGEPRTIREGEPIEDALNIMLTGHHRHLPIIDAAGGLVGIVSIRDVLIHIVGFFPADFINLPPDPDHEASGVWGG